MKKISPIAILAVAYALFPTASFSAPSEISAGATIQMDKCSLLSEDVKIPLSSKVYGAWNCVAATNAITVATCHQNGRVASRTVDVACGSTGQPACTTAGQPNKSTNSGAAIFVGSTAGGQLSPAELDGTLCTQEAVKGKVPDPT